MKRACSWFLAAVLVLGQMACSPAGGMAAIKQVASPVYPEAVDFDDTDAKDCFASKARSVKARAALPLIFPMPLRRSFYRPHR